MSTITLPKDLEDWARAEVAAGRAESVAAAIAQAVGKSRKWDDLCRSLDEAEAEAERDGWLDADTVFDKLEQRFCVRRGARSADAYRRTRPNRDP